MDFTVETMIGIWERILQHYKGDIADVERDYPEKKSILVDYNVIASENSDFAESLLVQPNNTIYAGEKALKEITGFDINIRIMNLPKGVSRIGIRDLRSEHLGKFIAAEGLVRKATEVRPKLKEAAYQCVRCGAVIKVSQEDMVAKEPLECYKDQGGCGKSIASTRFKLLTMISESKECSVFTDTQKLEIQESPEGLRGGAQPQRLVAYAEDDITGKISPGDRVILNGVLRSMQRRDRGVKSTVFDIFLDVNSIEIEEHEFEEISITPEDEEEIIKLSQDKGVCQKIISSIAPTIHGMNVEKEALALQLFGGVPKTMPDSTKVRGDIHVLLVGDPGTAKCVSGDTEVLLADGSLKPIQSVVEGVTNKKISGIVDDGIYSETNHDILSLNSTAKNIPAKVNIVWKRTAPEKMYKIKTVSGKEIKVTPTHPFFVCNGFITCKKAKELRKGEFIATPRKLDIFGRAQPVNIPYTKSASNNAVRLKLPKKTTPWFWRFIGLFIGEGYLEIKPYEGYISSTAFFTNNDPKLLNDFYSSSKKLGLNPKMRNSHKGKIAKVIFVPSIEFGTFLVNLGASGLSKHKYVPELLFKCSEKEIKAFLSALFDCEGTVSLKSRKIKITSASKRLMKQVQHLLLRFGVHSQLHSKFGRATNSMHKGDVYHDLYIMGEDVVTFENEIGFSLPAKKSRLNKLTSSKKMFNTNKDVIPINSMMLRKLRNDLCLSQSECGVPRSSYQHYEKGDRKPSRSALKKIVKPFEKRYLSLKNIDILHRFSILKTLADSDIFWDRVEKTEKVDSDDFVYDLQVPEHHNFIANDIYVHNSQLLRYITQISPRGIYASGKAASAAGLTAAAVRDEFGEGRWTLEAGALVLADKGIAAIDELDKMSTQDRSAMHEAMEQQCISVAKAGITATLHSRCALLGAANPKFGRFDTYTPISEQIDMPPALLSRFDLIFSIEDKPETKKDTEMAEHILRLHYAGEIGMHRQRKENGKYSAEDEEIAMKCVEPEITPVVLRKYIAYSKRHVFPVITKEAETALKDYYLNLRRQGEEENAPVPITPRQLEAFVRLSEASAKMRLNNEITREDADRAIRIMDYCMRRVYYDYEAGKFDVDVVATGMTHSQRERSITILDIIKELSSKSHDGGVDYAEIEERAINEKIPDKKVEATVEKLKTEGRIYQRPNGKYYPV
ncbi:MAG: cell division protein [Euryarchaeota archaeon CG01_land_8_20_14_3_00_38_12]|nr:MAG: cell division protein [Euryarchaeota archaeon CG01_land_8_20_14_3_00_38_12]PJB21466.1 MAG: cell division protein [Euryarchaeota archaeon CG_4_9_14_3_um_filter_38_12]